MNLDDVLAADHLPLFRARGPESIVAWRGDRPVTAARLLADIRTLAAGLPKHGPILNLCGDRLKFAATFCAAVLRGQVNLLPPNHSPAMIAQLRER